MSVTNDTLLLGVLLGLIIVPFFICVLKQRNRDYLQPLSVLPCYFFVAFFLKAILVLRDEEYFILRAFRTDERFLTISLLAAILGLMSFYFGYFPRLPGRLMAGLMFRGDTGILDPSRARSMTVLTFLMGVLVIAFVVLSDDSLMTFLQQSFFERGKTFFGRGWLVWSIFSLWLSLVTYLCNTHQKGLRFYRRPSFYVLFICLVLATSVLGGRLPVAALVITVLGFYHYMHRRMSAAWLLIVMAFVFILVVIPLRYRAEAELRDRTVIESVMMSIAMDFDQVDNFAVVLEHIPRVRNYFGGQIHYEHIVYPWYPRFLFPEKPIVWGTVRIDETYLGEYRFVSYNPSILGPAYADFGWPGIAAGMFLLGAFVRGIYMNMKRHNSYSALVVYIYFLAGLYAMMGSGTAYLLSTFPSYLLMLWIFRYLSKARAPARQEAAYAGLSRGKREYGRTETSSGQTQLG